VVVVVVEEQEKKKWDLVLPEILSPLASVPGAGEGE
jgi:hypothetical protein